MVQRQLPKPRDIAPLMKFKKFDFNASRRRRAAALTIKDLYKIARRRTPKVAFDYIDGASEVSSR